MSASEPKISLSHFTLTILFHLRPKFITSVWSLFLTKLHINDLPYFIDYNVHTSIVLTWISQWFLAKKLFIFFKNNFKRNNHCKFIHHKSYLNPFLSYLPCIVCREYFSIIFNIKKCALYSIKYGKYDFFAQW